MSPRRRDLLILGCLLCVVQPYAPPPGQASEKPQKSDKAEIARQIRFGAEMAKDGNWREALFRWQRALVLDPTNARLHNNLGVAYESLGDYDRADGEYRAALAAPDAPPEITENHELFLKFYSRYKESTPSPEGKQPQSPEEPADAVAP